MLVLIILIVLIGIGIWLTTDWDTEIWGMLILIICGIALLIHLPLWGLQRYDYGQFVAQRNAFEQTLNNARENGNEYETVAIVQDVAKWNQSLAERKFDNKHWLFGQYVDNRIETLAPIK